MILPLPIFLLLFLNYFLKYFTFHCIFSHNRLSPLYILPPPPTSLPTAIATLFPPLQAFPSSLRVSPRSSVHAAVVADLPLTVP